ncbi:nucleoside diphosphate kinase regulator [Amorphus coralli]|uniref:nucleoside diphosphate kinase regulator n=1 Tax=Amorphus coralli TaxID=340680 RepID=UPI000376D1FE|nr:nucleoside diphosphate kinase regulator [Amorphus coralli]
MEPSVTVLKEDHERLVRMASGLLSKNPDLAEDLLGELERARIVATSEEAGVTVQMGSTVTFSTEDGGSRVVRLVYPDEADIARGCISILTPIGTALLGLPIGGQIDFVANDGRLRKLTVTLVEQSREPV